MNTLTLAQLQLACIIGALVAKMPGHSIELSEADMVQTGDLHIEIDSEKGTLIINIVGSEGLH